MEIVILPFAVLAALLFSVYIPAEPVPFIVITLLFETSEPFCANIPAEVFPFIFIVPSFVIIPLFERIPTDEACVPVIVPVLLAVRFAAVLVLFATYIPTELAVPTFIFLVFSRASLCPAPVASSPYIPTLWLYDVPPVRFTFPLFVNL